MRGCTRIALFVLLAAGALPGQTGEQVYKESCAQCHDAFVGRTPPRLSLAGLTREAIVRSLDSGLMAQQGKSLSPEARLAVAAFLTKRSDLDNQRFLSAGACAEGTASYPQPGPSWNQWGIDGANSRFQPARAAGLDASDVPKLTLAWAVALPGQVEARSQPAVHGGRLFVGSNAGLVLALDARTGCRHWSFDAGFAIRGGIVVDDALYFANARTHVFAVDPRTGRQLWRTSIGEHRMALTTGTPQLHKGVLYLGISSAEEGAPTDPNYPCCTFRGSIVALEAATGKLLWRTHTVPEPRPTRKNQAGTQLYGPSGVGVWITPTIDTQRGLLYAATGDNFSDPPTELSDAVLALELKTGRIVWSRQLTANDSFNSACFSPGKISCPEANGPDHDFGQPPILVSLGGNKRALVIGQKSGVVHSLDPDNQGEILWQTTLAKGSALGGIQWGSASDGTKVYVAIGDLWFKGPRTLDSLRGGGLAALNVSNGKKVWLANPQVCGDRPNCSPAQSAAVTAIAGVVFSGSVDAHLRAYSSDDGHLLWDFDTAREFETVNGVTVRGGSIDGGHGPVIAGGFLYTNSGYGNWGGIPGNVLLAFCPPIK